MNRNTEINYLPPTINLQYFIPDETKSDLKKAVLMHLFYDLIISLKHEDFAYCAILRDELNVRKAEKNIDPHILNSIINFFAEYNRHGNMNDHSIEIIKSYLE